MTVYHATTSHDVSLSSTCRLCLEVEAFGEWRRTSRWDGPACKAYIALCADERTTRMTPMAHEIVIASKLVADNIGGSERRGSMTIDGEPFPFGLVEPPRIDVDDETGHAIVYVGILADRVVVDSGLGVGDDPRLRES